MDLEKMRKLQAIAKDMFNQNVGTEDYPFTRWEEQYEEMKACYERGDLSDGYIEFAAEGLEL